MEFIEHGHLGKYIAENQSKVDIKEITSQILEGLVVLHEQKICHRDLKPQVILFCTIQINPPTDKRISTEHPHRLLVADLGKDHRLWHLQVLGRDNVENTLRYDHISGA